MLLDYEITDLLDRERQGRQEALGIYDTATTTADDAQRQTEIQNQMTPEQRSVNDEWQESVRRLSGAAGSEEEDTIISESPVPSAHSDKALLSNNDGQDDSAGKAADLSSKGKKKVAFAMSAPVPMIPYRPAKDHTTGLPMSQLANTGGNTGGGHDDDDGCLTLVQRGFHRVGKLVVEILKTDVV
ncbi:hypothetical protein N0V86_008977 [Didymella sp. IMI 355093]|nr:hypothetical protein N0V86_008977 [Didymella sp. IMI 355093]